MVMMMWTSGGWPNMLAVMFRMDWQIGIGNEGYESWIRSCVIN